jgi:hypothetical protein
MEESGTTCRREREEAKEERGTAITGGIEITNGEGIRKGLRNRGGGGG